MGKQVQKDNSTFLQKVTLRQRGLAMLADVGITQPVVMETHGGAGVLFDACYAHLMQGVVFEKDGAKCDVLGLQRPTWAVYNGDCVEALIAGVGGHLVIDLLDVDPYGDAWVTLDAFFSSERTFADVMVIAVNDGLKHSLKMNVGWAVESMQDMVQKYGNHEIADQYLEVCRELLEQKTSHLNYKVASFSGYYTGAHSKMTHWLAKVER